MSPAPAKATATAGPPGANGPRARRRWLGVLGAALVALGAAYVTLPIWLPTGWLARRVELQLSGDLQRSVSIGRLSIGWIQGVQVEAVTIGDLPDAPNPHLVCIDRVQFEFTPLRTLFSGKVGAVCVEGPELWLVRGADGMLNVDRLPVLKHGRLPAYSFVIHDATCHTWSPQIRQIFRIDSAACRLEPARARLEFNASAAMPIAGTADPALVRRLAVDAHLTVPKLRHDVELAMSGSVRMEWSNLSLTDLPLALIPALPVEQVGGVTSGMLSFETNPDLSIDFTQRVDLAGVQLTWAAMTRRAIVPDALFACDGHWDPNTDHLHIRGLNCETQAIRVCTPPGGAIGVDPRGRTSLVAALTGEVKDWELLRREVPPLEHMAAELGLEMSGRAKFALEANRKQDEGRLALTIDGRESRWVVQRGAERAFEVGPGVEKTLVVRAEGDFAAQMIRPSVKLTMGDLSAELNGEGRWPAEPDGQAASVAETLRADVDLKARRIEQVFAMFPSLGRVPELADWRGPVAAKIKVAPAPGGSRVDLEMKVEANAALRWGETLAKPPGDALAVVIGLTVPYAREGQIDDLAIAAAYRGGALRLVPGQARLKYRLGEQDDLDVQATLPVVIGGAEDWAGLCPQWRGASRDGERTLSGALRGEARVAVSRRPESMVARFAADVDASGLALRWGREFDKSAGEPLTVQLTGRSELIDGRREDWLGAIVEPRAARLEATLARAGAVSETEAGEGFEQCTLDVLVRDVGECLRLAPGLAERSKAYQPVGAASVKLNVLRAGPQRVVEAAIDAGQAAFVLPGEQPGAKPAGVPAELTLRLEGQTGTAEQVDSWRLASGTARLAGLSLTEASGELTADRRGGAASEGLPPALRELLGGPVRIDAGHLHCKGEVACGAELERLTPAFARLKERLGLTGSMQWETEASGNGESLHFTGRLDARDLGWLAQTGNASAPQVAKAAGVPASVAVDVSAVPGPDGPSRRLEARVDANVDSNHVRVDGTASLEGLFDGVPKVGDADLLASVSLERPDQLMALVPSAAVKMTGGPTRVDVAIERHHGALRTTGGHARFQKVGIASGESALNLDGSVAWEGNRVRSPGLNWVLGESGGKINGQVTLLPDHAEGEVHLATEVLDVAGLQRSLDALAPLLSGGQATTRAPTSEDHAAVARRILAYFGRSDVLIDGGIGTLRSVLPPGILVESSDVSYELLAEHGPLGFKFAGTADGGLIRGEVRTLANAADPKMRLTYTAEHIRPGPLVDAYLRATFPGMTANGPLTLIDESNQKLFPAPGELNGPVGTGELIIEGGYLVGRAAPVVITRIFPGMNLARFDFSYMHSWFTKDVAGRIHHSMIYKGKYYNMYMTGYGGPDGFHYEVGVDFLADFDSKYWAASGQGRIPMFTKTGKLRPDGTIDDEVVIYKPQQFFETVLVRNNPVFTAYHAVRKRVRAEK